MKNIWLYLLLMLALASACSSGSKQPNLLVIYTDDQRVDALGCYDPDCPIETPEIDRLAEDGILFRNGFVTTPICMISRACLLSGRYECNHNIHRFHEGMSDEVFEDIYPVHLKQAGYYIGNFGKYGISITDEQQEVYDAYVGQAGQGPAFREYDGRKVHDAEWLTLMTRDFLDLVPEGRPFCLQLNYKEPHFSSKPAPEDLGALADHVFPSVPTDTPEEFERLPELVKTGFSRKCYDIFFGTDGNHAYLSDYFEKIMSVERSIGEIRDMLEERGLDRNTVIIFLSDHGTHFGEKQLGGKWTPYDESLRIPFIVFDPRSRSKKNTVMDETVLNIDVAPTLLDLAGIPVPEVMDGRSLVPVINGKGSGWRKGFFFEHFFTVPPPRQIARNEGMRTDSSKYVRWTDLGQVIEEFYRLDSDSMECHNLIQDPAYRDEIDAARQAFRNWRNENPNTYSFEVYSDRAQFGSMDIDWKRFKEAKPEEYEKISAEVTRLGVSWEQAVCDWEIRKEICNKADYWY